MHAPDQDRKAFGVENPPGGGGMGLRPSESVAKLESLERVRRQAGVAALAPVVVLKTGFSSAPPRLVHLRHLPHPVEEPKGSTMVTHDTSTTIMMEN
ncbi:hypothetical protein D1007_17580 [Hordeum vulgare]|nr:hypothetical protein D1007_17580 [Hordeum vulgare]